MSSFHQLLAIGLVFLLAIPTVSADEHPIPPEYQPLLGLLRVQEIPEDKAQDFVAAAIAAEIDGDCSGLIQFLQQDNETLAVTSGAMLALIEPATARKQSTILLRNNQGSKAAVTLTLSLVPRRKTIDMLLDHWEQSDSADESQIFNRALSAATEQNLGDLPAWKEWWSENRKTFKLARARSVQQVASRLQFADNTLFSDLSKKLGELMDSDSESAEALNDFFGNVFGQFEDMNKLGMERESREAERGDKQFITGQLRRAEKSYHAAVRADPDDLKSLFLLACLEFERGDLATAKTRFAAVVARENSAIAARFMDQLSGRRLEYPDENLRDAALALITETPSGQLEELVFDDPIICRITGQRMVDRGIYALGAGRLAELEASHHDAVEIQFGATLRSRHQQRPVRIGALVERFPDSPMVLNAFFNTSHRLPNPKPQADLIALCDRWIAADPKNLLPHIHRAILLHYKEGMKPDDGPETPARLPAKVWEDLIGKANSLQPNTYHDESIQAQVQVARMLDYPFHAATESLPGMSDLKMKLSRAGTTRIKECLETDQPIDGLVLLFDKLSSPSCIHTMMDKIIDTGVRARLRGALVTHLRSTGKETEAAELERQLEEAFATRREILSLFGPVESIRAIPVPSLSNALSELLWDGPSALTEALQKTR